MKRYHPYSPATPLIVLAPFLLTFCVFLVYPLLQSIVLATQQTFGAGFRYFVGGDNFIRLFGDPRFWIATRNTFLFASLNVCIQMPLALGLALLLNRPSLKGRAIFRLVIFSPALVGSVFVGVIFGIIFERRTGLLNRILNQLFNFDPAFPWLQEYVMSAMVIASIWMWTGYNMIYFLAALQNVDHDLRDAANIDGANSWQRFRAVTWPAIRPIGTFVILISALGSFQVFELPYLMFNSSAGPEFRGLTIVMYLYQNGFQLGDLGYASAIGWCLAVVLVAVSVINRRLSRNEQY